MNILVAGPQGSGKTTQAKILADKIGACFIGTGDLLREFANGESNDARHIKERMGKGELVDNLVVAGLVKDKLARPECQSGVVTDGYPRNFSQHETYDPGFDKVIYLDISDEEAMKRLLARGREDDTPEAIRERLELYHEETKPLLEAYQDSGKLVRVDGARPVEEIASDIEESVKGSRGGI